MTPTTAQAAQLLLNLGEEQVFDESQLSWTHEDLERLSQYSETFKGSSSRSSTVSQADERFSVVARQENDTEAGQQRGESSDTCALSEDERQADTKVLSSRYKSQAGSDRKGEHLQHFHSSSHEDYTLPPHFG